MDVEYRIGDEVIIDPNLKHGYSNKYGVYISRQMEALKGRIAKITYLLDDLNWPRAATVFHIDIDRVGYIWTADMFCPVAEQEEYLLNLDKTTFAKSLNSLL